MLWLNVKPVKIDPPQRREPGVSRLALRFKTAGPLTRVVVELYPSEAAQPPRAAAPVRPLAEWK